MDLVRSTLFSFIVGKGIYSWLRYFARSYGWLAGKAGKIWTEQRFFGTIGRDQITFWALWYDIRKALFGEFMGLD